MDASAERRVGGDESQPVVNSKGSGSVATMQVGTDGSSKNLNPSRRVRTDAKSSKSRSRSDSRGRSRSGSRTRGGSGSGSDSDSDSGGEQAFQYNTLPSDCSDDEHDSGEDAGDTQHGGYMPLPLTISCSSDGSGSSGSSSSSNNNNNNNNSDEGAAEREAMDVEDDGGSNVQSQLQLRLAEAQLLSLERDYQRTISMNGACGSEAIKFELESSQCSFLYDDDFEEQEPEDSERGGCDAGTANNISSNNSNSNSNSNRGRNRRTKHRKRRKKKNKSKGSAKGSRQIATSTNGCDGGGGAARSAAQRRREQLLEAAQLEIIVEHINAGEGGAIGPEPVGRTDAGKLSNRSSSGSGSSDALASGRRAKGLSRAERHLGLAPAESIRDAMHGFQLSATPSWAQSGDISRVIAAFCRIQVDRETANAGGAEGTTANTGSSPAPAGVSQGLDGDGGS